MGVDVSVPMVPSASTPGGPTALPSAPRLGIGVGVGAWSPLFRGRSAATAASTRASPFPDLETALLAYLRSVPSVADALTQGFGGGGFGAPGGFGGSAVKVYAESADPVATLPYLVLSSYTETSPGTTAEDTPIEVTAAVHGPSFDAVVALATTVKAAIDVPAANPASLGRPPLVWQGGVETTCWRDSSKPRKRAGIARGGGYPYFEEISYQFWVDLTR